MKRAAAIVSLLVVGAGCSPPADTADVIHDLRILAVKTVPTDVLFGFAQLANPGDAFSPIGFAVHTQLLVVDPQGRTVHVRQRVCPALDHGVAGCRDDGNLTDWERQDAQSDAVVHAFPSLGGELDNAGADLVVGNNAAVREVHRLRDGPPTAWLGLDIGLMVTAIVDGNAQEEVAFKRIPLSLALVPPTLAVEEDVARQLQDALQLRLCDPHDTPPVDGPPIRTDCIMPYVLNSAPRLVRLLSGAPSDDPLTNLGDQLDIHMSNPNDSDIFSMGRFHELTLPLDVQAGGAVVLRPIVAEHDHQGYQRIILDEVTGTFSLAAAVEDFAFSWYTTVGRITHTTSDNGRLAGSGLADATLTMDVDAPPGRGFVWVVVRDQRGGVDWLRVEIRVLPR